MLKTAFFQRAVFFIQKYLVDYMLTKIKNQHRMMLVFSILDN